MQFIKAETSYSPVVSQDLLNLIARQCRSFVQECVCGRDECAGECCEGVYVGVGDPVLHTIQ